MLFAKKPNNYLLHGGKLAPSCTISKCICCRVTFMTCVFVNESSLLSLSPLRCSPGMESATCSTLQRRGRRSAPPWREGQETAWRSCWTSSRTSTCRCGGTQVGMTTSSPVLFTLNRSPFFITKPPLSKLWRSLMYPNWRHAASKWIWDCDENQIKYLKFNFPNCVLRRAFGPQVFSLHFM